jgi:hypothetical protein
MNLREKTTAKAIRKEEEVGGKLNEYQRRWQSLGPFCCCKHNWKKRKM